DVDPIAFLLIEQHLLLIKIRPDERIPTLDVVAEVGQGAFLEHSQHRLEALLSFAFKDFEQERKLGGFNRLRVDVDTVNIIEENPLPFGNGELPVSARYLDKRRLASLGLFERLV